MNMAQYWGTLKGRGRESRRSLGDKTSGLTAVAQGWRVGAEARMYSLEGVDHVEVYLNTGSEGSARCLLYQGSEPEVIAFVKAKEQAR